MKRKQPIAVQQDIVAQLYAYARSYMNAANGLIACIGDEVLSTVSYTDEQRDEFRNTAVMYQQKAHTAWLGVQAMAQIKCDGSYVCPAMIHTEWCYLYLPTW